MSTDSFTHLQKRFWEEANRDESFDLGELALHLVPMLERKTKEEQIKAIKIKEKYNKLLDTWVEEIYKRADKVNEIADYAKPGSFKHGRAKGFSEGLIAALTMLTALEEKFGSVE